MQVLFKAAVATIAVVTGATSARADTCAANADALGTSRVLYVDPVEHPRIGHTNYKETLPLDDHEVVLTFDDGPSGAHTKAVLDALAAECVHATFFLVGDMARRNPALVKRLVAEGHTVATHTMHHKHLPRLRPEAAEREILEGIQAVTAAAGMADAVAPFFRFPYLEGSPALEQYLYGQRIMVWSVDFTASDWTRIGPEGVLESLMRRLEQHRKGVILLHDIHERTAAVLPAILRELKERGYRVVEVRPASKEHPKTETVPGQWAALPQAPVPAATLEPAE